MASTVDNLTNNIENATSNIKIATDKFTNEANYIVNNPSKIIDKLKGSQLFKNKLNIVILLFVLALLIFTAYIVYKKFLKNKLNPKYVSNNEFNNSEGGEEDGDLIVTLKLYHASEWCPFSRDVLDPAKGNWTILKNELNNTIKNGKKLVFEEMDCSKIDDDNEEVKDIDGYPTIKLITNTDNIIYNNDISSSNEIANKQLKEFINSNI